MVMKTAYIGPDTVYEKMLACLMVIFGSLVYIIVLASVVSMLTAYSKSTAVHRDHRTTVGLFCHSRNLSRSLRRRWFNFIQEDWDLFHGISTPAVLCNFPYHLHSSTLVAIHSQVVQNAPMFTCIDEDMIKSLLHYAKHEVILPKTMLMVEGKVCNRLFILVDGVLQASHSTQVNKVREAQAKRHSTYMSRRSEMGSKGESRLTTAENMTAAARTCHQLGANGSNPSSSSAPPADGGALDDKRMPTSKHAHIADDQALPGETKSQAFKRNLREAVMIERTGSMMGFPDPFVTGKPSVYSLSARAKVEVLAFDRHTLATVLCRCHEPETLKVCKAIEAEYNKLMLRLKAKEHSSNSVSERTESDLKTEEFRRRMRGMGDFNSPDHLNYLDERLSALEAKLVTTCEDAKRIRQTMEAYITPIAKVIFSSPAMSKHAAGRLLTPRGRHVAMRRGNVVNRPVGQVAINLGHGGASRDGAGSSSEGAGSSRGSAAPALPGMSSDDMQALLGSIDESPQDDAASLAAAIAEDERASEVRKEAYVRAHHANKGTSGSEGRSGDQGNGWRANQGQRGKNTMTSGTSGTGRAGVLRDGGGEDLENTAVMGSMLM